MNKILNELQKIIDKNISLYLPHVKRSNPEKKEQFFI